MYFLAIVRRSSPKVRRPTPEQYKDSAGKDARILGWDLHLVWKTTDQVEVLFKGNGWVCGGRTAWAADEMKKWRG